MKMSAVSRVLHPSLAYARTHNFSLINFHLNASLAVSTVVYIYIIIRVYNKVLDGRQKKKKPLVTHARALVSSFVTFPCCVLWRIHFY